MLRTMCVLLLVSATAMGAMIDGQRAVVNVGHCWKPNPADPSVFDGLYYTNRTAGGPVDLLSTADGSDTGSDIDLTAWACSENIELAAVETLYDVNAQSDARNYTGAQPVTVTLSALDPTLLHNVGIFSYSDDDIIDGLDDGVQVTGEGNAFSLGVGGLGTCQYTLVSGTCAGPTVVTVDTESNSSVLASFLDVTPSAGGVIAVEIVGINGNEVVPVNVVDVTATPEPATLALLVMGGLAVVRRRK